MQPTIAGTHPHNGATPAKHSSPSPVALTLVKPCDRSSPARAAADKDKPTPHSNNPPPKPAGKNPGPGRSQLPQPKNQDSPNKTSAHAHTAPEMRPKRIFWNFIF